MSCPIASHDALKRDPAAWSALRYVGIQHTPADETGPAEDLELRDCPCGSTLSLVRAAGVLQPPVRTRCDGCGKDDAPTQRYRVTRHDGSTSEASYCEDCAGLARIDWNGETKAIERAELVQRVPSIRIPGGTSRAALATYRAAGLV